MPKSKVRKKPAAAATPASRTPVPVRRAGPSPLWYPVAMAAVLLIGLAYIVIYYLAGASVPGMKSLGAWNLGIGFGILVVGLIMSVRWR